MRRLDSDDDYMFGCQRDDRIPDWQAIAEFVVTLALLASAIVALVWLTTKG